MRNTSVSARPLAAALRDLVREVCKWYDIEILKGHVRPDHVHLLLSVPPTMSASRVVNAIPQLFAVLLTKVTANQGRALRRKKSQAISATPKVR
jgi:REP element-mobilizing transposase RayT